MQVWKNFCNSNLEVGSLTIQQVYIDYFKVEMAAKGQMLLLARWHGEIKELAHRPPVQGTGGA